MEHAEIGSRGESRGIASASGSPDPGAATGGERRADIQALRAFAVTAVVLFHVLPGVIPGGFIGVDVFFVISGFLVGGHLFARASSGTRINFREFYARRARRIVPLSALVAAVTIAWASFTASPLDLMLWGPTGSTPTYTRDAIASVLGVSNLWFGVSDQGYLADGYQSPLTQYWSLGVEEQFYVLAPLVLALLFWRIRSRKLAILVIVALSILSLDLALYGTAMVGVSVFFNPLTRAWELAAGLLVAATAQRLRAVSWGPRVGPILAIGAWVTLCVSAAIIALPNQWPSALTLIPVSATAFALAAGTHRRVSNAEMIPAIQWVGDRSYSIYLWHWPVLAVAVAAHVDTTWMRAFVAIVGTLLASWASYRWVESPMRRMPVTPSAKATRTLAVCASIGLAALIVIVAVGVRASTSEAATDVVAMAYRPVPAGTDDQEFAQVVPQNLRPSIVEASQDLPLANTDGCNVTARGDDNTPTNCIYGSQGPVIALFGDSHALQWLGALSPGIEAGQYRVAIVTASSCPPYGGAGTVLFREGCAIWQPAAIQHLKSLSPSLVLVSASTWNSVDFTPAEVTQVHAEMEQLVRDLDGLHVAWIADTPTPHSSPNTCALEHLRYLDACTISRELATESPLETVFADVVSASGWDLIDLNDYACSTDECGLILGDVFLYRDSDHITTTFSSELAPVMDPLVLEMLGER